MEECSGQIKTDSNLRLSGFQDQANIREKEAHKAKKMQYQLFSNQILIGISDLSEIRMFLELGQLT